MFKRILVASDGSDHALNAAGTAARLAKDLGSELTVLYVYTPLARVTPFGAVSAVDLDPAVVESIQSSVIERTTEVIREYRVPHSIRTEIGYPSEVIVGIADSDEYDLVVIGSRGLSGIKALFLGSVSDRVVHTAHCAVLVVK